MNAGLLAIALGLFGIVGYSVAGPLGAGLAVVGLLFLDVGACLRGILDELRKQNRYLQQPPKHDQTSG